MIKIKMQVKLKNIVLKRIKMRKSRKSRESRESNKKSRDSNKKSRDSNKGRSINCKISKNNHK